MSILNELYNQLCESEKQIPVLQDDDLAKSCFGLVKDNDGLYKSDKQGWFIQNKVKSGERKLLNVPNSAMGVIETKFNKDYGIIWRYVLDDRGVLQKVKRTWKWKQGMSPEQVKLAFKTMTFKQREQNAGLEQDMMQGKWQHIGDVVIWERND